VTAPGNGKIGQERTFLEESVERHEMFMSEASVLRTHWRHFIWAWMFPVVIIGVALLPAWAEYPTAVFFVVVIPAFLVCSSVAWKPVRTGEVSRLTGFLYVALLPLLIWITILLAVFGLPALTHLL
jgi:FtsH-binding integral membrane protein